MDNLYFLQLMHKTNNWIELLSKEPNNYPSNWTGLKEVQLAHIYMMDRLLETKNVKIPQYKYEKGITIGAGGAKYFGCAFACFYVLRKLGCTLPVEFWYLDEYEMDNKMKQICNIFGITYVNATQYCKNNHIQPRILKGWELKPFATLYSNFKEVLYLDADNIPYKDPTYLFDDPEYKELGSMFWPDLPPGRRKEWLLDVCWHNVGLEYRDEPDFETGQYLINKEKCYKELQLTMWMNEHSDWFYKFVYGDKSTFHLAWRKCGSNYSIPQKPAGWRRPCILQYDTQGDLVFQHACQGKESIFEGSGPKNQNNYNFIREAYEERRKYWSGTIYSWSEMSEDELNFAKIYIGKYNYTRINLGSRVLELLDGGEIGEGKAACERRWSVRTIDNKPTIVAIGSQHKDSEVASFFAKDDGDNKNFSGSWTIFEKCDITLEKVS